MRSGIGLLEKIAIHHGLLMMLEFNINIISKRACGDASFLLFINIVMKLIENIEIYIIIEVLLKMG
ncbi:hypothetical protein UT300018_09190 [Clostridium faecium]